MTRRKRSDSAAGHTDIAQGALSGAPNPPAGVTISEAVRPFWELVTTAKAKRSWTKNDLVMAAEVARCMYRLEVISNQLETYLSYSMVGADIQPDDEVPDTKEMEKLADTLAKRIRLLSAHLQIHAEATQGKSREQVKQNETHKKALDYGNGEAAGDDLIPGLTVQ